MGVNYPSWGANQPGSEQARRRNGKGVESHNSVHCLMTTAIVWMTWVWQGVSKMHLVGLRLVRLDQILAGYFASK